jgi:S-formylglutathione hydrolase FrmB
MKNKLFWACMLMISSTLTLFSQGTTTTYSHSSWVLGRSMSYNVYLPPSYNYSPNKYYPVLYLLHGMYGNYASWEQMGCSSIANNAISNGSSAEMIIVMPDGLSTSFYSNENGYAWETYFHNEFMPMVENQFRINAANGGQRAISGFSMGGYGATYNALKYQYKFSSSYAMSAAYYPEMGVIAPNLDNLVNSLSYLLPYVMECGTNDWLVWDMNVRFDGVLNNKGLAHNFISRPGSHDGGFWQACLPKALAFATQNFNIKNGTTNEDSYSLGTGYDNNNIAINSGITGSLATTLSAEEVNISPNPANSVVYVTSKSAKEITIYNLTGKQIEQKKVVGPITSFDVSNLAKGMYLIKVDVANNIITKRVIVE